MTKKKRNLEEILSREKVLFYGIGNQFRDCLNIFQEQKNIVLFDSNKSGMYQEKFLIHAPEELQNYYRNGDAVVISSIKNQYEIAKYLVEEQHILSEDLFSYTSPVYEKRVYQPELIQKNQEKIRKAYDLLGDEESKKYWENSLLMRMTRQPLYIQPNVNAILLGEYKGVVELEENDVIIDCGAYIGDTADIYINRLSGNCFVHALEPFRENFLRLQENVRKNGWDNVKTYHCAVGEEEKKSMLYYEKEDFKMGVSFGTMAGSCCEEADIHTLDNLFMSLNKIDYLKMDIEGEEVKALHGAEKILKDKAPKLMISGYHKLSDFWEIPCLINEINPAYRIYVGHAPGVSVEVEYYCRV